MLAACEPSNTPVYAPSFGEEPTQSIEATYRFGIHPLHNPGRLYEVFGPLMAFLSQEVDGATFKLEASRNYAAYDTKLYNREFDFSLPNPYQTVNALKKGYRVIAKMGDDANFRGILIVRKDSGIKQIHQLRGKAISYPAPTALAATMMPQLFLQEHGIDVDRDLDNRYVGSQESSIMNVFLGHTAAAATWPPPWRALSAQRPELADKLEVKWQTEPLINNSIVVLPSVPKTIVKRVAELLTELHTSSQGREILAQMALSRFETADNKDYDIVNDFLQRFSDNVRPVSQ